MNISEVTDRAVKAKWRHDLTNMLTDVGRTLAGTGLQVNGVRYQGVLLGPLLMQAAAALEECWKREGLIQAEAKPDKPGDVVVKITVPDRWPMTEAGQRRAAQEAAATKPVTNSGGQTMAEYIDRVEYCEKYCRCNNEYCNRQSCPIWEAPAADVAPVVRGRGSGKPMVEPVQPLTAQAAPKPMTNGDRIQDRKDGELAERERLERLYEETRQIADRRAWDETSRTMAYNCGQEAKDGQ